MTATASRPAPICRSSLLLLAGGLLLLSGCGEFSSRGLNSQGVRLFGQNRYQEAMQNFQEAVEEDPSNPDSYYNLAATYHRLGTVNHSQADLSRAEQNYHLCLDRDPNHRDCYRGLAVLLAQQDRRDEAFRLMNGWVAQSPTLAEPKIELARLLEETGDLEGAKQRLTDALAVDDKNASALAALGRLRERTGDRQQALAAYERSLMYDRFQSDVANRVADLRMTVGATVPAPGAGTSSGGTGTAAATTLR